MQSRLAAHGRPLELDPIQFDAIVRILMSLILVDFWATMAVHAKLGARGSEDLARHAIVARVNGTLSGVWRCDRTCAGFPNVVLLHGGRSVTILLGMVKHNQIENWLRSAATARIV
jgi:thioredoxin 2